MVAILGPRDAWNECVHGVLAKGSMDRRKQYAALPYLFSGKVVEVCLITSRETGRWIIPKGWPEKGMSPTKIAALEAFEEAGLKGETAEKAVGRFRYLKRLDDGSDVECDVKVFPMLVKYQATTWPEQHQRERLWIKPTKAAKLVDDKGLAVLLTEFDPS